MFLGRLPCRAGLIRLFRQHDTNDDSETRCTQLGGCTGGGTIGGTGKKLEPWGGTLTGGGGIRGQIYRGGARHSTDTGGGGCVTVCRRVMLQLSSLHNSLMPHDSLMTDARAL